MSMPAEVTILQSSAGYTLDELARAPHAAAGGFHARSKLR